MVCSLSGIITISIVRQAQKAVASGGTEMFQDIDKKALAAQRGSQSAISDLVDSIFAQNAIDQLDPSLVATLKDRIVRAQVSGHTVSESQVVQATNWLMGQFSAPTYAQTSLLQTRSLRLGLNSVMPNLFLDKDTAGNIGLAGPLNRQPSSSISPSEGCALLIMIVHQKVLNPSFQKDPAQWDADYIAAAQSGGITQDTGNASPEFQTRTTSPQTNEMHQLIYGTNPTPAVWANMAHGVLDKLGIPE